MPGTYEPIATTTLSNNYLGIVFDNIPQTYTDLVMIFKGNITQNFWDMGMRFNSNSSSYSNIAFAAQSTTIDSAKNANLAAALIGAVSGWGSSGLYNIGYVHIYQYTNTNINKVVSTTHTNPEYANGWTLSTWANTAAISSIYLYSRGGGGSVNNLVAGSQITLYGIKAA